MLAKVFDTPTNTETVPLPSNHLMLFINKPKLWLEYQLHKLLKWPYLLNFKLTSFNILFQDGPRLVSVISLNEIQ